MQLSLKMESLSLLLQWAYYKKNDISGRKEYKKARKTINILIYDP